MANVAGTKATGPVSKNAVSGGKTFTPSPKFTDTNMPKLTNTSEEARRKIMGLRMQSTGFGTNIEGTLTKAPR